MSYRSPYADVDIPEIPLPDFVFGRAQQFADKPALIDGPSGRTLTYGQLEAAVNRTAAGLAARAFKKGDVLAIYSPNLPEYAVAFMGAARVGGVNTTVNPLYTAGELKKQLKDSNAKFLVTVPPFVKKATEAAEGTNVREIFVFGEAPSKPGWADL